MDSFGGKKGATSCTVSWAVQHSFTQDFRQFKGLNVVTSGAYLPSLFGVIFFFHYFYRTCTKVSKYIRTHEDLWCLCTIMASSTSWPSDHPIPIRGFDWNLEVRSITIEVVVGLIQNVFVLLSHWYPNLGFLTLDTENLAQQCLNTAFTFDSTIISKCSCF